MQYYFFSIDDSFYNTLYSDFSKIQRCNLVSMGLTYKCPALARIIKSWKLPTSPWIRGKIAGKLFYYSFFDNYFPIKSQGNCYIIYARVLECYGPSLLTYLKKKDKNGIFICYFGDVVESFNLKIKDLFKGFDLIYSLDRKDAKKYGLRFLQEPYSYNPIPSKTQKYDVVFVGSAKNRLDKIYTVYDKLKEKNFRCKFFITGVPNEKQKQDEDIIYNKYLDYSAILNLISESRAILEILQEDADTTTTRYSEALLYNKYLITDSDYLRHSSNLPSNIIPIDYSNWDCLEKIKLNQTFDNTNAIKDLSIQTMIETISKDFKK
ncbi:MAG: hypothetical protein IKP03_05620 [Fibrobacter sp.]|nr:hypothetical protein [Fibrobacter sp.]